jgi:hypothetical protein
MKRVLLLLSIVIVFSSVLIKASAFLASDNIYDNNYMAGLFNNNNPEKVTIFPNPVIEDELTITAENSIMMIEILDIVGSSVFIQKYDTGTNKVVLSLENLNKGLYIIKVKLSSKITYTEKIMIK